ncbi:hypothetical protein BU26DRAFT_563949 [Trematosphaeria pertusa]|uniref:Uncharacterized protein n=1 Tax=Trematosphaeria pertusa TaxID=390896 RepID=A0A6A6IJ39_9PLEO|nr:uncharacterized protein BU26DRAFT_563949 [Trematosphaeria pertusa]KAF2250068.1 hypothetical protein BU26DRAFT_563949 [Trematosphaeria pertusa]
MLRGPGSDYVDLENVLEVYWHVFDVVVQCQELDPLIDVEERKPCPCSNEPMVYILKKGQDHLDDVLCPVGLAALDGCASIRRSFKPKVWQRLERAYLMWNQCDFALDTMFKPIREKLRTIGARADWLSVDIAPKFLLNFAGDRIEKLAHSVMAVTTSCGNQYIVDFTIEQFGYDCGEWLMPEQVYLEQYTTDGCWRLASAEDQDVVAFEERTGDEDREWRELITEFCYALDWAELDGMSPDARIAVVQKLARGAFGLT